MDPRILLTTVVLTLAGLSCGQEARILELTSQDGRAIKGEVGPGTREAHIHLKRSDGTVYRNIPLTSFSADSQQAIRDRLKEIEDSLGDSVLNEESKLKVSFHRQKSSRNNDYGDIDDKVIRVQPRVTIESDETKKTYQKIKGEVIVVGQEVLRKKDFIILDKQSFQFAHIPPDGKVEWEGKPFKFEYDPDYGGFDYDGYLVVLRNKDGSIGMIKGSSSHWERIVESLFKAPRLTGYDKSFTETRKLYTTYGLPDR